MSLVNYNSLFDEIKSSINGVKSAPTNDSFSKILKFKCPKFGEPTLEYMFRILPYVKEGKEGIHKTFYHFVKYFWQDDLGQYHSVLSRKTFNEQCIISNYFYTVKNRGTEYEKKNLSRLNYRQGWYCNVYVISDPVNPSNNGKVMVLALVKTLWKKILSALNGELDDEWSARFSDANPNGETVRVNVGRMITDLSNNGVNFSVKVGNKGAFPDYEASEFTRREAKLNLTEAQQESLLNACIDPASIDKVMSSDEIAKVFKETFLNQVPSAPPSNKMRASDGALPFDDKNDQIPGLEPEPVVKQVVKEEVQQPVTSPAVTINNSPSVVNTEDDMDTFLKGYSDETSSFDFS